MAQRGSGEQRPEALPDGLSPPLQSGVNVNGGRPPRGRWFLPREEHHRVSKRLGVLGNVAVLLQAHMAARLWQLE